MSATFPSNRLLLEYRRVLSCDVSEFDSKFIKSLKATPDQNRGLLRSAKKATSDLPDAFTEVVARRKSVQESEERRRGSMPTLSYAAHEMTYLHTRVLFLF